MIEKNRRKHIVDVIFPVMLFFLFTFCVLSVLGLAIRFYQSTVERGQQNEDVRVAVSYVREVVRQNNKSGAVTITEIEKKPCLKLDGGDGYVTYIFLEDGMLKELYAVAELEVSRQDGQEIMPLKTFEMEYVNEGLMKIVCCTEDGCRETMLISRMQEKEENGAE